jgi:hypothetical protein
LPSRGHPLDALQFQLITQQFRSVSKWTISEERSRALCSHGENVSDIGKVLRFSSTKKGKGNSTAIIDIMSKLQLPDAGNMLERSISN